ncbi:MAG: cysteine--tRNA ligase [Holosporaceae bacterium]
MLAKQNNSKAIEVSVLYLHDTKARKKRLFAPITAEKVQMYVCGPTVYDRAHLGNARSVVVFDVLYRVLLLLYPDVCYVRNITDVDDKIIEAAAQNKISIRELTQKTLTFFHQDMASLGVLPPTLEPKATAYIPEMIAMIERLVEKGFAYVADAHVMFHVKHYKGYGALSGKSVVTQKAGARVGVEAYKKSPEDFVLWKPSAKGEPGWESPWGHGRPGWHIECSAMSDALLDVPFDIHGGGQDLVFPHHENERAQSCCALDQEELARFWLHNGFLVVEGEKMSKSLGNFFTVENLLQKWDGEVIRWALLSAHYKKPLDWSEDLLLQAKKSLDALYSVLAKASSLEAKASAPSSEATMKMAESQADLSCEQSSEARLEAFLSFKEVQTSGLKNQKFRVDSHQAFFQSLLDDLNTPKAFSELHALIADFHKASSIDEKKRIVSVLSASAFMLGFGTKDPQQWLQAGSLGISKITKAEIEKLITQRREARLQKNFKQADAVRQKLLDQGVILEDSPQGTTWRRL